MGLTEAQQERLAELKKKIKVIYHDGEKDVQEVLEQHLENVLLTKYKVHMKVRFNRKPTEVPSKNEQKGREELGTEK